MHINLSTEGIFPIIYDSKGEKIFDINPNTNLSYEGSVQGEGALMGVPSLFIRTSGCNLRCLWQNDKFLETCDTPHTSWNNENLRYRIDEIISVIKYNTKNINHIVITGGEPLIQAKALTELCARIKTEFGYHITIETNGTIFYEPLLMHVDLFSISPKLSNSNPTKEKIQEYNSTYNKNIKTDVKHEDNRYNSLSLSSYVNWNKLEKQQNKWRRRLQLKFVVSSESDIKEIKEDYIDKLPNICNEDIYLMPLGMTPETLNITTNLVLNECIKNNWNFTGRLHINLFKSNFGV